MGFGDITGTRTYLTYVRLEERASLEIPPSTWFNRANIAAGEEKVTPWSDSIRQYLTKTVRVRAHGCTGTLSIITGFTGTRRDDATGTYYQSRVGVGSFVLNTFTESVNHLRASFKASIAGSVTMAARFQA